MCTHTVSFFFTQDATRQVHTILAMDKQQTPAKMEDAHTFSKQFQNRSVQTLGFVYHDTNDQNHGPVWKTQLFLLTGICTVILWQDLRKILLKHGWEKGFQLGMLVRTPSNTFPPEADTLFVIATFLRPIRQVSTITDGNARAGARSTLTLRWPDYTSTRLRAECDWAVTKSMATPERSSRTIPTLDRTLVAR